MRILFVNQYFPPDSSASAYLLGELAEDLAQHHEVHVVAGRPSYSPEATTFEPSGVLVRRSWSTSFDRAGMARRLSNYGSFIASALGAAMRMPRPDVVVALTDPPAIGVVGMLAARRFRVPFVYVCQDIFPDVAVALSKLKNRQAIAAWRRVNRRLWREADRIVVIGRDMQQKLAAEGVPDGKLALIRNWGWAPPVDEDRISAVRRARGWDGRFIVMLAGNIGLAQAPHVLLEAAKRSSSEAHFVFLGDGAARPSLQQRAEDESVRNVQFAHSLPKDEAQVVMAAADLHVVSLAPGLWGCVVPSRVYGIMAAARPFIASVDAGSEAALLASDHECGLVVPSGDARALADAIASARSLPLAEMGMRGRHAFEQHYERRAATDAYRSLLEDVAS